MTNILLSCAGRRKYLADFFRAGLAGAGKVVGSDMNPSAPALAACDVARIVPACSAPDYLDALIAVISEENIAAVFSLNDLEIELLARNREMIEARTGAKLYVPPLATATAAADKWATFTTARRVGLAAPATFLTVSDALAAVRDGRIGFPLVVKPRWGSASIGIFFPRSPEELERDFTACAAAVRGGILAANGLEDAVIIQEAMDGTEYGVDILYGQRGDLLGFTAKRKIAMRAGETDKAVSVEPGRFADMVALIVENFPSRGNLDCDFIEHRGQLHLLEINPRFGGGYPFTHMAGANHVAMLLDELRGRPLPAYGYQAGRAFAKCDMLIEVPAPDGD